MRKPAIIRVCQAPISKIRQKPKPALGTLPRSGRLTGWPVLKIGAHVHVTPPEISANLEKYMAREPYFALLSANPKNRFATAEDVVAELDRAGFDRAVVFGFAFRDAGLCRMVNDYVIEKVSSYPERLSGFAVVQPSSRGAAREAERTHEAGLCGVGELFPSGQCFDISDAALTGAFTSVCAERDLPILIHANEPVGHYYTGKTDTTLRQLELFVEHSPGNDIILAHWGGGLLYFETMPEPLAKAAPKKRPAKSKRPSPSDTEDGGIREL